MVIIGGFVVFREEGVVGGRYVAGSAVGVGFGHRGSIYPPGPHCNGTTELHAGSSEPKKMHDDK